MKVLLFNSDSFDRDELDKMTLDEKLQVVSDNPYFTQCYDSIADFQEAFNGDNITDQNWIYFEEEPKESFPITSVSREDLDWLGFDTTNVTDSEMERLASKLGDDYCDQLYWTSLEIIAEMCLEIPRKEKDEEDEDD